jgi:replicative DNA helicase
MTDKHFGHLGTQYQLSLLKILIEDKKFAETIIDVLDSTYFENGSFRFIMQNLKEYNTSFKTMPSYDSLKQKIISENSNDTVLKSNIDTIENIKSHNMAGGDINFTKEKAVNFCKQQVLKKAIKEVESITVNGEFEEYHKIENIIQKALQVGITNDELQDVFDNIGDALKAESRCPIPTGILGIDNLLKGGLGRGELGVVLAPTGTGKTTLLTKFANSAYNTGSNVVQIFFEDNINNIKKKHYTLWTGISPDDQVITPDETMALVEDAQSRSKGQLRLLKLPSDSVTINTIKSKLRKLMADGFKIDLLTLDYIDCISPERSNFGEEWKGEGSIMRSLEAMTSEFDIAIWTATQGNRESISSEVVTTDQMGGSIKKAQIGHVVMSIGKTLEQKEHNLATLTLLKSRIGKDGVVFSNCKFNNEYLDIDVDYQNTLLGHKEDQEQNKKERIKLALEYKEKVQADIKRAKSLQNN